MEKAPRAQSVRHQAGVHRLARDRHVAPRNRPRAPVEGARRQPGGRMTTLTKARTKKTTAPATALPGGYAGKILRVDMTKGKCWAEAWSAEQMREQIGGVGLGAMI